MKKSFRLVGLILIAVMSLGLTACGSEPEQVTTTTQQAERQIHIITWYCVQT